MGEKRVEQGKLDGTRKPLFATERERNGIKEKQLPMPIGNGERPIEELPLFQEKTDDAS